MVLCICFLLVPHISNACAKEKARAEQAFYSKNRLERNEQEACCKTNACKKSMHHKQLADQCGQGACTCTVFTSSLSFHLPDCMKMKVQFGENQPLKFAFKQACYSSGYTSVWLPPKIG